MIVQFQGKTILTGNCPHCKCDQAKVIDIISIGLPNHAYQYACGSIRRFGDPSRVLLKSCKEVT